MKPKPFSRSLPLASAIAALLATPCAQAANGTWGANANTAWYTNTNWVSSTIPGLQGVAASNTDIATFNSTFTGTTPGINMGTNSLNLGAISIDSTRTTATNIGNSSATGGVLRLYGATVNGVSNVIVRNAGTGLLTLQAAQNGTMGVVLSNATDNIINIDGTGGVTISSIISESATGRKLTKGGTGSGVLTLTGVNSYTGATTINSGTINLGGGTATGSLASTVLTLSGGAFSYTRTGNTTQSFTTTNINAGGASQISVVSGNTLNLGTVVRGAGGSFNFANAGAGTVAALAASNDASGIMAGFTFGDSWAVANGAGVAISGLSSYTLTSVAGTTAGNYTGFNMDVNNSPGTLGGTITTNSLRFSAAAANTLDLATGTNTISSGGIMVGSGVGANLSTISGGTLTGPASKNLNIIQNNTAGGLTISSLIANNTSTALTKSGGGLLTLSGNNSFTGGVFINGGVVALDNAGALNSTVGSQNAVTFEASSTGTLALTGYSVTVANLSTNAATPGTTFVQNANGSSVANVTLTVGNSTNASGTFAGIIRDGTGGGTLALTKAGTGTLALTGANTYSGGTTLTAGTVVISNATSFGAGNVLVTGSSRINASGVGNPTYGNAIDVGAPLTLQIPNATPGTATFSGQLTGSSAITVAPTGVNGVTGTYAFTHANNTFTGNILLPAGTSGTADGNDFFTFNSIGDGGNITFQKRGHSDAVIYTGSSAITFNNRQLVIGTEFGGLFDGGGVNPVNSFRNNASNALHTVTFKKDLTPGAIFSAGTLFFGGSNLGDNSFDGVISNPSSGGNLGIGKSDGGKWIFTRDNTFLGNVKVSGGTLSVGKIDLAANAQPLGKGTIIELGHQATAGTLEFTGSTTNSTTDKQVQMGNSNSNVANAGGAFILNNGSRSLTFTNAAFNPTVATVTATRTLTLGGSYNGSNGANEIQGVIQDNVLSTGKVALTASGSIWTLSGPNTYTGATTIQAGSLVAGADSLGTGTTGAFGASSAGAIVLGNGSTLAGSAPTLLINGAFTVGRAITVGSVAAAGIAYNATIGGSNTSGTSTYTGNITLNTTANSYTATLQAATGGTVEFKTGTWATNNKAIRIGSSGNTGTVKISNAIATSGGINVNFGTLELNSAFTGGMTVASGSTISGTGSVSGTTGVTSGTVSGTGLALTGATTFNGSGNILNGTVTSTSGVTLASGADLALNGALTGTLAVGSGTLTGTGGSVSGASTLNGGIINLTSGSFASTLGVTGGAWNGAGSVTGLVTSSSGTFTIGSSGNLTASAGLAVSGGTLAASSGSSKITGSVNYTSNSNSSFAGEIAGSGNTLTMNNNASTLTLTGTSSYTGATNVTAGTLVINGSISTSLLTTVASGATLGGSGTVGALTIASDAFVTPGNSPGILNVAGNYIQAGQYTADLTGTTAGTDYDQIIVAGSVDITGGSLVTMFSGGYSIGDMLFILLNDGTDSITGIYSSFAQGATVASFGGFDWVISYNADSTTNSFTGAPNGNDIALMAVPEPNAAAIVGGFGVLALLRRRRA